jgi:polyisoprenoid-binding protein YceI
MKSTIIISLAALLFSLNGNAQKYFTRSGYLGFFSKTSMEDIKADNNKATFVIDAATGQIEISALQTAFEFEKALMQEHYNENYVESEKYPKATFKGKLENIGAIQFTKDGVYQTKAVGELSIHGVTRTISIPATITVKGGVITAEAKFTVSCKEHNIEIPSAVKDNINDKIDVTAKATLQELKK